jgi:hypothetical protein
MLSSGGFAVACLQAIAKGGSSILGLPGQTRAMSRASTTHRPVHTLTTVEGAPVFVPPRTPRSSGFGYIQGPFLVSKTGCARERHAPCIEGPFLVNRTGHARERHAP